LWQRELAVRPIDTPERRAELEARLMAQAALIADRSVQNEYRRFLRDRLFALARPLGRSGRFGRQPARRDGRPSMPPGTAAPAPPPPRDPRRVEREILLVLLLRHPFLIDEKREEAIQLDFPEPELDRLRRAILRVEDLPEGLDAATLRQHLGENGFTTLVDSVFSSSGMHAAVLLGSPDPDYIRRGWAHVVGMMRRDENRAELASARQALASEYSPESLARLQALHAQPRPEELSEDEASERGRPPG
jgi:DNA primase